MSSDEDEVGSSSTQEGSKDNASSRRTPTRSSTRAAAASKGLPTAKNKKAAADAKEKNKNNKSINNKSNNQSGKPPLAPKKGSDNNNKKSKKAPVQKKKASTAKGKKSKVKKEIVAATTTKAPNYTTEEDLFICKAFVSVSTDPTHGTNQKGDDFWSKVAVKFADLQATESEVEVVGHTRDGDSIMNRFQRQIQRAVNKFNKYYKEHKEVNPSGWNEEKFIQAATDSFLEHEGKPFKWQNCIAILHQMPKFNPMMAHHEEEDDNPGVGDDDSNNSKRGHNKIGGVMGDSMDRPIGSKAAKRLKKEEISLITVQSAKVDSMKELTGATNKLADALVTKAKHDTWMKQATFFANIGNMGKAQEFMQKLEQDQMRIAEEESKATAKAAAREEEEEEEAIAEAPVASITINTTAAGLKSTGL